MDSIEDMCFAACRDYVKAKLLKPSPSLLHHEKEKFQVLNLFERTVANGESNSALLIGPRSSGKSVLVNEVLYKLCQLEYFKCSAVIVYLNGLIHTDDAIALKAIACQMGLGNVSEGRTFGSLAENLTFFLECLKSGNRDKTMSTIIIIDEFHLFCSHSRQTLLYNLFDVAQSAQAPLCVLGITCRLDVVELLEKRVKSRFSNRNIYLFPQCEDKDPIKIVDMSRELLSIQDNRDNTMKFKPQIMRIWNKEIKSLCNSHEFHNVIKDLNYLDLSESRLRMFLLLIMSKLNCKNKSVNLMNLHDLQSLFLSDPIVTLLGSLSVLEICLIIAMKQHYEVYDEDPFNFEMIVRIYVKFVNQNSLDYTTDRSVLMKAFENVVSLEFIIPVKSTNSVNLKEHQMYKLALLCKQIEIGVQNYQNLPTEIRQWMKCGV